MTKSYDINSQNHHVGFFDTQTFEYDLTGRYAGGGRQNSLNVSVTSEGVIMDVVEDGKVIATVGMMADEWSDTIELGVI